MTHDWDDGGTDLTHRLKNGELGLRVGPPLITTKYDTACYCLEKDRAELLYFYNFPAGNWSHLETTDPIESTFATIGLRHRKTKGNGSRCASLAMMFKLTQSACLNGSEK